MWKKHGKFLNNLPKRMCKTINQFNHGWLPVNASHSINASGTGRLCPFCLSCDEDQHHFLTCTHQHLNDQWKESSTIIESKMTSYDKNTPRQLIQLIGLAVTDWRTTSTPTMPDFLDQRFHQLFQAQSLIGWDHILEGHFSKKWRHTYSKTGNRPVSGSHTPSKRYGSNYTLSGNSDAKAITESRKKTKQNDPSYTLPQKFMNCTIKNKS
jgi:hypothetical protein